LNDKRQNKTSQYLKNWEKDFKTVQTGRQKTYKITSGDQAGTEARLMVVTFKNGRSKKYIKLLDGHLIIR
jgi:uncharacterized protein YxeA